ncbi:MAG: TatD family hydrolase [Thermoguttaceae bacterium]|nr:TatD family hydrolase [Thermoguttaceae bacterium]
MSLELFDTHAHFDLDDFDADRDLLIERCRGGLFHPDVLDFLEKHHAPTPDARVVAAIDPGVSPQRSRLAVSLARRCPWIRAAAAIHPNYTAETTEEDFRQIELLGELKEVVAIGETGLDRHWDASPIETQIHWFSRHIELACRIHKPLIIHCREAIDDLLTVLRQKAGYPLTGTIHSFSEGPKEAEELLEMGFHLGFTGCVTYTQKKFAPLWEAAKRVPDQRLLIETDSPFLVPHPLRGKLQRNEPLMTLYVARRLAELRDTTVEHIVTVTAQNARRLFAMEEF